MRGLKTLENLAIISPEKKVSIRAFEGLVEHELQYPLYSPFITSCHKASIKGRRMSLPQHSESLLLKELELIRLALLGKLLAL